MRLMYVFCFSIFCLLERSLVHPECLFDDQTGVGLSAGGNAGNIFLQDYFDPHGSISGGGYRPPEAVTPGDGRIGALNRSSSTDGGGRGGDLRRRSSSTTTLSSVTSQSDLHGAAAQFQRILKREQTLTIPVTLTSLAHVNVTQIACGESHLLLLSKAGDIYAFGVGESGQLGLGVERLFVTKPERVPIPSPTTTTVVISIAAGHTHSVALDWKVSPERITYIFNDGTSRPDGSWLTSPRLGNRVSGPPTTLFPVV